jgi:hypothetical protein
MVAAMPHDADSTNVLNAGMMDRRRSRQAALECQKLGETAASRSVDGGEYFHQGHLVDLPQRKPRADLTLAL